MASRLQPYPRRLPSPWHRPLDVVSVVFGCFWLLFVCFVVHHPPRMLPFFFGLSRNSPYAPAAISSQHACIACADGECTVLPS